MERNARSTEDPAAPGEFGPIGRFDSRPLSDLEAVVWRPPPGWVVPEWFYDEPEPANLPMTYPRFGWCLHAIGWSLNELARRIHGNEATVRQMARGRRLIPDTLAIWLEMLAARSLNGPLEPPGWRPRPVIGHDGVPIRNPR